MTDESSDFRRNWRASWLCCLLSLADIDLQRERWLDKEITHPHWSYIEFMAEYFDDCLVGEGYTAFRDKGFLSNAEFDCIRDFHEALDQYRHSANAHDPEAILADPRWQEVTAIGGNSLQFLRALITDPSEQEIFATKAYARPLTAGDFSWPARPS